MKTERGLFSWVVFVAAVKETDRAIEIRPIGVFKSLPEAEHFCGLPGSQPSAIMRVANLEYSPAQMRKAKRAKQEQT